MNRSRFALWALLSVMVAVTAVPLAANATDGVYFNFGYGSPGYPVTPYYGVPHYRAPIRNHHHHFHGYDHAYYPPAAVFIEPRRHYRHHQYNHYDHFNHYGHQNHRRHDGGFVGTAPRHHHRHHRWHDHD